MHSIVSARPFDSTRLLLAPELQSVGLKITPHRLRVLEVFQNSSQRHMSAEEVFRVLMGENSDIGLATVYRTLSQFESVGIVRRHHFEHGKAVFELRQAKRHFHPVCLGCGSVTEFFDAEMELRQREIASKLGFEVRDETLAIYGTCAHAACRAKANRQGSALR